jgi:hypothetical protein
VAAWVRSGGSSIRAPAKPQGNPINSNRFIALMSAIVLRDHPGTTIVTDSVTSNGLTTFIEGLGGKHCRRVLPLGVQVDACFFGPGCVDLWLRCCRPGEQWPASLACS